MLKDPFSGGNDDDEWEDDKAWGEDAEEEKKPAQGQVESDHAEVTVEEKLDDFVVRFYKNFNQIKFQSSTKTKIFKVLI